MINELPPMVQVPPYAQQPYGQQPYGQQPYGQQPYGQQPNASHQNSQTIQNNPYYEEVVRDHPGVQSKIRVLDPNPYGKYEETIPQPPPPAWNNIPDYSIISDRPGAVQQNYLPSDMVPRVQSQHLPVAPQIPVQYNRPMLDNPHSGFPVIENYQMSCRDVMAHIKECPICARLYGKNDTIYLGVIAVMILLIFVIIFRVGHRSHR
jgi:hypothetical protein